jgi:hypothetical protein
MMGGARPSVTAAGRTRGWAGWATGKSWAERAWGKRVDARVGAAGPGRRAAAEKGKGGCFLFFSNSYSLYKQANQFEFKPGFESKHSKKQCSSMNATVNSYISLIN